MSVTLNDLDEAILKVGREPHYGIADGDTDDTEEAVVTIEYDYDNEYPPERSSVTAQQTLDEIVSQFQDPADQDHVRRYAELGEDGGLIMWCTKYFTDEAKALQ